MKKIMKKALSLMLVLALVLVPMTVMAATGDYTEPYQLEVSTSPMQGALRVSVAPGATQYIQASDCNNSEVNVGYATGDYMLQYGRQTIYPNPDEDKTASFNLAPMGGDIFSVYNPGEEDIVVYFKLFPGVVEEGTMDNPKEVTLSDPWGWGSLSAFETASLEAGNEGYYYTLTATDDGAILVSVNASDDDWNEVGWFFYVNNITANKYGDFHWSDEEEPVDTEVCPVSAGDEVVVFAATYDPSNQFNNPAGNVSVNFGFATKGSADYPEEITVGSHSANVEADSWGYNYTYVATEEGTLTVSMDDNNSNGWTYVVNNITSSKYGDTHWHDDDPVVSTDSVSVRVGDKVSIMVNTYNPTGSAPAGTVNWTLSFEAGSVGDGDEGEQGGGLGGDEDNYEFSNTVLQVGDNPVTLGTYEWTLFEFTPDETGEYLFQTDDGVIGYWGAGTFFVQEPDESTLEGNLRATVTSVGQSVVVGITSVYGENTCNILITRVGDAEEEGGYDNNEYVNVVTPEEFTFPGNAETLLDSYVDTEDDTVDTAVLGDDGYYHLNSANGPVLFANLSDEILSLVDAQSFGQLSAVNYENGVAVSITDFYNAFDKYVACADTDSVEGATLYPLTEDLITIFQLVGNDKGWYGEYGYLGGTEEDAWMFACYYDEAITSLAPATDEEGGTTGGATTDSTTSNNNTSSSTIQTGDNTNAFVWVAVMMVGLAAVVVALKKRAR